jgi:thioredoxin
MSENQTTTKPIVLHDVNFDRILAESELPLLFEFWASWCHHCTALSPIIDEVAEEMGSHIIVGQINCDLNRDLCKRFEVKAVPALFLAKRGKVLGTTVNPMNKEALISWVEALLG